MKYLTTLLLAWLIYVSAHAQNDFVELSHYVFAEFEEGCVLMKGGRRNNTQLNYNTLTEEMIFDKNGMKMAIGQREIPNIDTVFIQERKFVPMNGKFIEAIYSSAWQLYVDHRSKLQEKGTSTGFGGTSHTAAATSASNLTMDNRVLYNLELPEGYVVNPYFVYWLKKDGEMHEIITLKQLKKLFADKKNEIKNFNNSNKVKYHDQGSIIRLIAYLESN